MSDRSNKTAVSEDSKRRRGGWSAVAARGVVHITGVFGVAMVGAWLALGVDHLRWLVELSRSWGEPSMYLTQLATHIGLSAVSWALLYVVVTGLCARGSQPRRQVHRARGAVLTETLIVMPVLLFLILGIAQLAINNLAGMLLNYGTSQAARVAWVWQPELDPLDGASRRMDVRTGRVQEMARLQVAAAMTPVAPSAFGSNRAVDSEHFEQLRASFLAVQINNPPNDSGGAVRNVAMGFDDFFAAEDMRFTLALDEASYPERTTRKFTSAYGAVDLEVVETGSRIGVEVAYSHQITFPLMGPVFGEPKSIGGSPGMYMVMNRNADFLAQLPPNAEMPTR